MGWFAAVLTILLITLKLCGLITWSWIWVLAPLWGFILFVVITIVLFFNMVNNSGKPHFI